MRTLVSFLALSLLAVSTASAQDYAAAGKHFAAAQAAFGDKHYKVAASEFQAAFDIAHDSVLLYNVAESWEKAGEGRKAVAAYKAYLKAAPKAQDKAEVQKRIKTIVAKKYKLPSQSAPGDEPKTEMAKVTPTPTTTTMPPPPATTTTTMPPPPATTTTPPPVAHEEKPQTMTPDFLKEPATPPPAAHVETAPPPSPETTAPVPGFLDEGKPSKMRIAAWVGVAGTIAFVTAGAIFGLAAQSRADEISRRENFVDSTGQPKTFDASQQADYNSLKSDGQLYNTLAITFFSLAGASAIITTTLFVLDVRRHRRMREEQHAELPSLRPAVNVGLGGAQLKWSF